MQWNHIKSRHREFNDAQLTKISLTLENPDFVLFAIKDNNYQYYKRFDKTPVTRKHLLVIAKHLNDEGFIITAMFVAKVRKIDKVVVYGKENLDSVR